MTDNDVLKFNISYDIIKSGNVSGFIKHFNDNKISLTEKNKDGYSLVDAAVESDSVDMLRTVLGLLPETSEKMLKEKENLMNHALTHVIYPKKSGHILKLTDLKVSEEMRIAFIDLSREISEKHTDAFLAEGQSKKRTRKPKI